MLKRNSETAKIGHEILPFEMGYLPEYFQKIAKEELNDTPENRERGLRVLREMMQNDKSFIGTSFDDDFLLQYLRCKKFNVSGSFTKLKAFVNLREKHKYLFTNLKFENIAVTTRNNIVTFLPYRCPDGCAILHIMLDNWEPEEFPPEEVKRMVVVLLLQSLRDPMNQVNGFKVIFNVQSNPIKHIKHVTPSNLHLLYYGPQECSPGRYKSIHIINTSLTFKTAWFIIKLFLPYKLKQRIFFHEHPTDLLNHFPRAVLPEIYGGDLKNYDMTDWLRDVMLPEKLETLGGGGK